VAAGFFSQNGNGEMTGVSWIAESGTFSGPVAITNTHAVGVAHAAIIAWTVQYHPRLADAWLLPVAAETWDGYLNDINGQHVTQEACLAALAAASSGPIEALAADNPMAGYFGQPAGAGSVIAVVATDAPLLPHQCQALARRVTLGLARTGTTGSHFSGDLFLAFSTASPGGITPAVSTFRPGAGARYDQLRFIPWGFLDPFFGAVVQGTEEAVLNALVANEDMTGRAGHRTPALRRDQVVRLLSGRRAASTRRR